MLVPFRGGNRPDQPTGAYDRVGQARGVKKIRARGYPQIKSVMGTGRVAKRVPADIINGYLTTRYFMDLDTDMMIPVPADIRTR